MNKIILVLSMKDNVFLAPTYNNHLCSEFIFQFLIMDILSLNAELEVGVVW